MTAGDEWSVAWAVPPAHDEDAGDQLADVSRGTAGLFGAAVAAGRFAPVPVVAVDGVDVAAGAAGAGDTLMAVDGVTVTWGRDELLDQPTPATGRLVLFDATRTWATIADRRGLPVTIRYQGTAPDGSAVSAVYFRGRIGSPVTVSPRTVYSRATGERVDGSLVELPLRSILVDLGNTVPRVAWPAETMGQRTDRIRGAAQEAGILTGGADIRAFWRDPKVAPVAAKDQDSLLGQLVGLFDSSGADRMTYRPDTDAATFVPRRDFSGSRGVAGLWWDGTDATKARGGKGAYIRSLSMIPTGAGLTGAGDPCYLDAATLEYEPSDGLTTPERITRVAIAHPDEGAATPYSTRNIELLVRDEDGVPLEQTRTGTRTASQDSLVAWNAYADIALSDLEYMVRREGSAWLMEPLRFSSRRTGGFETLEAGRLLLSGFESNTLVFVQRSWLSTYGIRPVFGVMGGRISYARGGWDVEAVLAPISTTPAQHAISWSEIDDGSATYELQWWDEDHPRGLHESVTWEDIGFCATGLNVTAIPADTGWDQTQR